MPWVDFVQAFLSTVNNATNTFLTGYVAIRFAGKTRPCLGMQQWSPTFSIEIATLQGVDGELELLTTIIDLALSLGGLPHWGELVDLGVQGNVSIYPRYFEFRNIYANLSSNFTARTFENDLSVRWQLTTPSVLPVLQLNWSLVNNSAGFGNLPDGQHPIWIADFTGSGHAQVMFYYSGDGNWWLGNMG